MEQAEAESNDLVNPETEAMNALEGLYKDASGDYTVQGTPDPELARSLLYSEEYHSAKERIIRPIEQFFLTIRPADCGGDCGTSPAAQYAGIRAHRNLGYRRAARRGVNRTCGALQTRTVRHRTP